MFLLSPNTTCNSWFDLLQLLPTPSPSSSIVPLMPPWLHSLLQNCSQNAAKLHLLFQNYYCCCNHTTRETCNPIPLRSSSIWSLIYDLIWSDFLWCFDLVPILLILGISSSSCLPRLLSVEIIDVREVMGIQTNFNGKNLCVCFLEFLLLSLRTYQKPPFYWVCGSLWTSYWL